MQLCCISSFFMAVFAKIVAFEYYFKFIVERNGTNLFLTITVLKKQQSMRK